MGDIWRPTDHTPVSCGPPTNCQDPRGGVGQTAPSLRARRSKNTRAFRNLQLGLLVSGTQNQDQIPAELHAARAIAQQLRQPNQILQNLNLQTCLNNGTTCYSASTVSVLAFIDGADNLQLNLNVDGHLALHQELLRVLLHIRNPQLPRLCTSLLVTHLNFFLNPADQFLLGTHHDAVEFTSQLFSKIFPHYVRSSYLNTNSLVSVVE